MPVIFVDDATRVIGATLTDQEFALVGPIVRTQLGQEHIMRLFEGMIGQLRQERINREKNTLRAYIEQATDAQRAALLAAMTP